jgi:hypothetical protein
MPRIGFTPTSPQSSPYQGAPLVEMDRRARKTTPRFLVCWWVRQVEFSATTFGVTRLFARIRRRSGDLGIKPVQPAFILCNSNCPGGSHHSATTHARCSVGTLRDIFRCVSLIRRISCLKTRCSGGGPCSQRRSCAVRGSPIRPGLGSMLFPTALADLAPLPPKSRTTSIAYILGSQHAQA